MALIFSRASAAVEKGWKDFSFTQREKVDRSVIACWLLSIMVPICRVLECWSVRGERGELELELELEGRVSGCKHEDLVIASQRNHSQTMQQGVQLHTKPSHDMNNEMTKQVSGHTWLIKTPTMESESAPFDISRMHSVLSQQANRFRAEGIASLSRFLRAQKSKGLETCPFAPQALTILSQEKYFSPSASIRTSTLSERNHSQTAHGQRSSGQHNCVSLSLTAR